MYLVRFSVTSYLRSWHEPRTHKDKSSFSLLNNLGNFGSITDALLPIVMMGEIRKDARHNSHISNKFLEMVYFIGKHLGGVSFFHCNSSLSKKHFILLFSSALVPTPILPAAATNRFFLKTIPGSPELPNKPLHDEIALIHTIHPSRMTRISTAADGTCPWILVLSVNFPYFFYFFNEAF